MALSVVCTVVTVLLSAATAGEELFATAAPAPDCAPVVEEPEAGAATDLGAAGGAFEGGVLPALGSLAYLLWIPEATMNSG